MSLEFLASVHERKLSAINLVDHRRSTNFLRNVIPISFLTVERICSIIIVIVAIDIEQNCNSS